MNTSSIPQVVQQAAEWNFGLFITAKTLLENKAVRSSRDGSTYYISLGRGIYLHVKAEGKIEKWQCSCGRQTRDVRVCAHVLAIMGMLEQRKAAAQPKPEVLS